MIEDLSGSERGAEDADADINMNFDDFKSALKTESSVDKVEAFMNSDDVYFDKNKLLRTFLS